MTLIALTPEPPGDSLRPLLEYLIAKADAGELSSLAIAVVRRDGSTEAHWTPVASLPALIGATARLQRDLLRTGE